MRHFTQAISEDDAKRKDMLLDIATEELSHLEVIGSIVSMLCKGVKAKLAEGTLEHGELMRDVFHGGESHILSILYGGGVPLMNSGGASWTAAYIDTMVRPTRRARRAHGRAAVEHRRGIASKDRLRAANHRDR
jgi:manganese catalase